MASEANVQSGVWSALARVFGAKLFRTNSGKAYLSGGGPVQKRLDGSVVVPFGRPVALGLALTNGDTVPGLSDLTGFTPIKVTQEMVDRGDVLPVFTVIETKASKGGVKMQHQRDFIATVQRHGGIAGFANSEAQALEIIEAWKDRRTPNPL